MVEYMGQGVKNGSRKICGRQPLINLKWYVLLSHHFKFLKGCFPQMGPFLNNLSRNNCNPYIPLFSPRKGIQKSDKIPYFCVFTESL